MLCQTGVQFTTSSEQKVYHAIQFTKLIGAMQARSALMHLETLF